MNITVDRKVIEQALEEWHTDPGSVRMASLMIALRTALTKSSTCTWYQDGDYDSSVYGTSCKNYFNIADGTPEDNKMQWCCYCGKKLVQELITEDEDE